MFSLRPISEEVVLDESGGGMFLMDEYIDPESFTEEGSGWEIGSLLRLSLIHI